jgi:tight adherence protein C
MFGVETPAGASLRREKRMLLGVQVLLSLLVGLSVLALINGVRTILAPGQSTDRMQQFLGTATGPLPTLQDLEMRASFFQRAIKPIGAALLKRLGQMAPQKNIEDLHRKLETAGFPANMNVMDFLGLKVLFGALLGAGLAAIVYLTRSQSVLIVGGTGLVFGFVGFMLPNYWLMARMSSRKTEILRSLPDILDQMTICVDAGLGLQGAMQTVCEEWDNALSEEFTRVLAEIRLGRTRTEAFEGMGKRTGVSEIMSFVLAITLADKLGVPIAKVLHIQAEQMRVARRQRAEELARQASIKMLFPLVFLIFPATFAVILGPAIPQLLETFSAF